jgi:hypothetical protein
MLTPWGEATKVICLEKGISFVLTKEHGGLILEREYAEKKLSYPARKRGLRFGDAYVYEMDCAWAIALWELPHLWSGLGEKVTFNFNGSPEKDLNSILVRYFPDYLKEYRSIKSYMLCRP